MSDAGSQPDSDLAYPAEINRLIHEPARLLIMANLRVVNSADFTFLMNRTGLTWGNLSSHISKLEDAGYVSVEKTYMGKRPYTLLSLSEDGIYAFDNYTTQMHEFLGNFL